ncbi:MAG: LysR family transcriptional regulator [Pseudomonadota bacterium]
MSLPSLTLLRAFEAAARHGGFSAAARELNVTHAAIAQNVRKLEVELGQSLLRREGQRMVPTSVGAQLAEALTDGLTTMARGVDVVRDLTQSRPVRMTCTPTFAEHSLMPHLGSFWSQYPDIQLSITPSNTAVDLRREGFDVAIRHGRGPWPGTVSEPLALSNPLIVATPRLCSDPALGHANLTEAKLAALRDLPWVIDDGYAEYWRWLGRLGIDTETLTIRHLPTNQLVLAALREGFGAGVQPRTLVARELDAGTLVQLHEAPEADDPMNWIVTQPGAQRPALKTFIRWLKKSVATGAPPR